MRIPSLKEAYFLGGRPEIFRKYKGVAEALVDKGFSSEDFFGDGEDLDRETLLGVVRNYTGEDLSHLDKQDLIDLVILIGNTELGQDEGHQQ